ncbi:MAG: hypothetical protein ACLUNV_03230 [Sutterella wadsworthensis]
MFGRSDHRLLDELRIAAMTASGLITSSPMRIVQPSASSARKTFHWVSNSVQPSSGRRWISRRSLVISSTYLAQSCMSFSFDWKECHADIFLLF